MNDNFLIFNVDHQNKVLDYSLFTHDKVDHDAIRYIQDQVTMAQQGSFVPDERICWVEGSAREWPDKPPLQVAREYVAGNSFCKESFPTLRDIVYAFETSKVKRLDWSGLFHTMHENRQDEDTKKKLQSYFQYHVDREMKTENRPVTGIVLGDKMLCFDDSGRGLHAAYAFLQHIADHYFYIIGREAKDMALYYYTTSDQETINLARRCSEMIIPSDKRVDTQQFPLYKSWVDIYDNPEKVKNLSPAMKCEVYPDYSSYQAYLNTFHLQHNYKTENIAILTYIAEKGLTPKGISLLDDDFAHKSSFQGFVQRINSFPFGWGDKSPGDVLQSQARDIARRILKIEYGINNLFPEKKSETKVPRQKNNPTKGPKL